VGMMGVTNPGVRREKTRRSAGTTIPVWRQAGGRRQEAVKQGTGETDRHARNGKVRTKKLLPKRILLVITVSCSHTCAKRGTKWDRQ
jgi:hypothetical protein